MDHKPLNLAIIGCGNIARAYGKSLQPYPQLKLLGATDHILKLAEDYVATFGGKVYPTLEALLADDEIDLVINLTIHRAHVKEPYAGNTAEDPHAGVEWSRGVLDMAEAMQENRPQRITGAQAAHVVDIVCGIETAFREGRRVQITSEFPQPAPMDWAK